MLRRANDTEYGLASGVFTRDIGKALYVSEKLDAGTVFINTYNKTDVASPFGGFKQSGFGKDLGKRPSLRPGPGQPGRLNLDFMPAPLEETRKSFIAISAASNRSRGSQRVPEDESGDHRILGLRAATCTLEGPPRDVFTHD